jgi:hypothetical protein
LALEVVVAGLVVTSLTCEVTGIHITILGSGPVAERITLAIMQATGLSAVRGSGIQKANAILATIRAVNPIVGKRTGRIGAIELINHGFF